MAETHPQDDGGRIYRLSDEHDLQWADVEDLVPKQPTIPDTLLPFYPTGDTVEDVEDLQVYTSGGAPHFAESELAVEATPQEMAEWLAAWAEMGQAQQTFRDRLDKTRAAYEAAAQEALAELGEAMKPWLQVEVTLKARAAELAAMLHSHRVAAEKDAAQRETKRQAHLDTIHGPRAIVLYKPKSLNSHRQDYHIARVHLVTCKRRSKLSIPVGYDRHADEGLRAGEAWRRLNGADEWTGSLWGDAAKNMRVKFCSFCKPWTVFQEHLQDFPRPHYDRQGGAVLGEIRLTDIPEVWTNEYKEQS
ncbi:hypothetical protein [Streptomyces griseoaurantiacus]|uniref:hypothetical protein n=1 Tax=Streptomyces griseoaurantiacus TaxID=68213 RepID=UPI0036738B60